MAGAAAPGPSPPGATPRIRSDRLVPPERRAALLLAELADDVVERALELLGGGGDRALERARLVAHGDRLVAGDPRLHQAALVAVARLVRVRVVELDDHADDLLAEPAEGPLDL